MILVYLVSLSTTIHARFICIHTQQSEPDLHRWRVPKMEGMLRASIWKQWEFQGISWTEPWTLNSVRLLGASSLRRLFSMFSTLFLTQLIKIQDCNGLYTFDVRTAACSHGSERLRFLNASAASPKRFLARLTSQPPCFRQPAPKQWKLGCLGLSWVVSLITNLNQQISLNLTESRWISLNLTTLSLALSFICKEICESHELSVDVELDVTHIPISLQKGDVCFHHPNAVHLSEILEGKKHAKITCKENRTR